MEILKHKFAIPGLLLVLVVASGGAVLFFGTSADIDRPGGMTAELNEEVDNVQSPEAESAIPPTVGVPVQEESEGTSDEVATALTGSDRPVTVDFSRFSQLLPRDAIEPIYFPQFITADNALLNDSALVIGVSINGESKAYPIGPLNRREMVNDVVGGVPVLVTW